MSKYSEIDLNITEPVEYNPVNPKINLYLNGHYQYSTNWCRTCKLAKQVYAKKNPNFQGNLTASRVK